MAASTLLAFSKQPSDRHASEMRHDRRLAKDLALPRGLAAIGLQVFVQLADSCAPF